MGMEKQAATLGRRGFVLGAALAGCSSAEPETSQFPPDAGATPPDPHVLGRASVLSTFPAPLVATVSDVGSIYVVDEEHTVWESGTVPQRYGSVPGFELRAPTLAFLDGEIVYARGAEVRSARDGRVVVALSEGSIRSFVVDGTIVVETEDRRIVSLDRAKGKEKEVARDFLSIGLPFFARSDGNATRIYRTRGNNSPLELLTTFTEVPVRHIGPFFLTTEGYWVDVLRKRRIKTYDAGAPGLAIAIPDGVAYASDLPDGIRYLREMIPFRLSTRALLPATTAAIGFDPIHGMYWLSGDEIWIPAVTPFGG